MSFSIKKAVLSVVLGSFLGVIFTLLFFDGVDATIIFSITNSIIGTILVITLIMKKEEEEDVSDKISKMFNSFPKFSEIKFPKLFIHSLLLLILLTFLAQLSKDIVVFILRHPIKGDPNVTLIVFIWMFFALQSKKYRKQDNND